LEFGLEILQLGFKRVDGLVNLLLVVPVHPGEGEDPDPGKSDDGQSVHECSNVGQQVHGNSELDRFKNILHQQDRLQFGEDAVQLGEKSISDLGHLVSRESHIDVQELLEWVSLLGLVDCGQDGLVDPEAHGGGHQGQGEVPNYADE